MPRFRTLFILAISSLLASACASIGGGESQVPVVEVTAGSLNIRQEPSTSGVVLGSLTKGERVQAPKPAENGWIYIESASGTSGYVSSRYVRTVEVAPSAATSQQAASKSPPPQEASPEELAARPPIPGTPLARVELSMTEAQVIDILGQPMSQQSYMTGKAWIPFYFGSDTSRLDYKYKKVGVVVFGRNRWSGATRVIRVDYNPDEDGL